MAKMSMIGTDLQPDGSIVVTVRCEKCRTKQKVHFSMSRLAFDAVIESWTELGFISPCLTCDGKPTAVKG